VQILWLLLNDLKGLLLRFSRADDLATDTGAGRYEHNIKLIPILMSAIIHKLSSEWFSSMIDADYIEKLMLLLTFLSIGEPKEIAEVIQQTLVVQLFLVPTPKWNSQLKQKTLKAILKEGDDQSILTLLII
jgi:E3 ubiquitin-protein ligase UBR4